MSHDRLVSVAQDPEIRSADIVATPIEDGFQIGLPDRPIIRIYEADAQLEDLSAPLFARVVRESIVLAVDTYRAECAPEAVRRAVKRAIYWKIAYVAAIVDLVLAARAFGRFVERRVERRLDVWEKRARNVAKLKALWALGRRALRLLLILVGFVATYGRLCTGLRVFAEHGVQIMTPLYIAGPADAKVPHAPVIC